MNKRMRKRHKREYAPVFYRDAVDFFHRDYQRVASKFSRRDRRIVLERNLSR